jgi:hypothetical protein
MVQVVFGMKDWLAALRAAGVSPMRTARAVGQASHRDLTPRPAANALHEIHFRRIGATSKSWSQALQKMIRLIQRAV